MQEARGNSILFAKLCKMLCYCLSGYDHDAIIRICLFECIGDIFAVEPDVEIFHLVSEFFYIIDDNQGIGSQFRKGKDEVVEVLSLHAVDVEKVEIRISKSWYDLLRIPVHRINILGFAVREMFDSFFMRVRGVFYRRDVRSLFEYRRELES